MWNLKAQQTQGWGILCVTNLSCRYRFHILEWCFLWFGQVLVFIRVFEQEPICIKGVFIISISGANVLFALFLLTEVLRIWSLASPRAALGFLWGFTHSYLLPGAFQLEERDVIRNTFAPNWWELCTASLSVWYRIQGSSQRVLEPFMSFQQSGFLFCIQRAQWSSQNTSGPGGRKVFPTPPNPTLVCCCL